MCPLCRASEHDVIDQIPVEMIYRSLSEQLSVAISPHIRERLSPGRNETLVRCRACGLEYFEGATPGDNEFYAELTASSDYYSHRWEFDVVANRLEPGAAVVDFGAGAGEFLCHARDRAGRLVGIDHSPEAIAGLTASGFEAHTCDFAEFADNHVGAFDAATGFHILEHLTDVSDLIEPMMRALRPGGRLFLSTPNRHRVHKRDVDSLDCPPHHLSRWSPTQMERLAEQFTLSLARIDCEPAPMTDYVFSLRERAPGPRFIRRGVGVALRNLPALRRRYNELVADGGLEARGIVGFSMLAEFVRV